MVLPSKPFDQSVFKEYHLWVIMMLMGTEDKNVHFKEKKTKYAFSSE